MAACAGAHACGIRDAMPVAYTGEILPPERGNPFYWDSARPRRRRAWSVRGASQHQGTGEEAGPCAHPVCCSRACRRQPHRHRRVPLGWWPPESALRFRGSGLRRAGTARGGRRHLHRSGARRARGGLRRDVRALRRDRRQTTGFRRHGRSTRVGHPQRRCLGARVERLARPHRSHRRLARAERARRPRRRTDRDDARRACRACRTGGRDRGRARDVDPRAVGDAADDPSRPRGVVREPRRSLGAACAFLTRRPTSVRGRDDRTRQVDSGIHGGGDRLVVGGAAAERRGHHGSPGGGLQPRGARRDARGRLPLRPTPRRAPTCSTPSRHPFATAPTSSPPPDSVDPTAPAPWTSRDSRPRRHPRWRRSPTRPRSSRSCARGVSSRCARACSP
ncbi:MAG: hypothetical protein K0S05_2596 [Agromyces sp.]|nr:hypothetical protein [Agromyces sp.]